jgi:glycosyltransferase involved in cell wall biosynthesis
MTSRPHHRPGTTGQPHVVVVEYRAHEPHGHFQVTFAGFATAFAELGCTVDALTAQGWSRAAEHPDAPFTVRTMGWGHQQLTRGAGALVALAKRLPAKFQRTVVGLADVAYNLAAIGAARSLLRQAGATGGRRPGVVLLLNKRFDPRLVSVIAGDGIWMTHPFGGMPDRRGRWLNAIARAAESRRRTRGGRTVVGVYPPAQMPVWQRAVPWVELAAVEVAGVAPMPNPGGDRASLGLPDGPSLALVFGEPHVLRKDLVTVVKAFDGLDHWHLVVAGRCADSIAATVTSLPANVTLLTGAATEHQRFLLHHLCDAAILSFVPGHRYDSGTLADAIAAGLPVVVSTPSLAADTVERFGVGTTFLAGDAHALGTALASLPTCDPAAFDAARQVLSFTTLAATYLQAAGLTNSETTGPAPGATH